MHVKPATIDAKLHPGLYADLPDDQKGKATLKVIDPARRDVLPPEGRQVADGLYWHRRLRDKDVVPCTAAEIAALEDAAKPRSKKPDAKAAKAASASE